MSTEPSADFVTAGPAASPAPADTAPPKVPQFNVYTVMLGLTLLFVILACVFLAFELNNYEFKLKP
jgi:hypothetical protein